MSISARSRPGEKPAAKHRRRSVFADTSPFLFDTGGEWVAGCKSVGNLVSGSAANSQEMEGHPMPNADRIIRLKTVLDQTGLTRSTLYRKIDEGTFPRQIRISTRGTGWRESEVKRWIADPMGYDADELDGLA